MPGHAYEISVEYHVRNEIVLNRVSNWELLAPQTEEEYGESLNAVSLEIRESHDILIANYPRPSRHTHAPGRRRPPRDSTTRATLRFRNAACERGRAVSPPATAMIAPSSCD